MRKSPFVLFLSSSLRVLRNPEEQENNGIHLLLYKYYQFYITLEEHEEEEEEYHTQIRKIKEIKTKKTSTRTNCDELF